MVSTIGFGTKDRIKEGKEHLADHSYFAGWE
jgi:hypothetical protein